MISKDAFRSERNWVWLAAAFFVIEQLRLLYWIGIKTTSEDQTIFWYAAQDYLHFHFTEPFFYGSPYSSHFEAALAAPLMGLGIAPWVAVPLVTIALTAAPWLLLAWAAYRRGSFRAAAAVLLARFVFPLDYGAINARAAEGTGIALVGIAAALLLIGEAGVVKYAVFGFLGALATALYPNSIFLSAPVGVCLLMSRGRERSLWQGGMAGAALGGLLYLLGRRFYVMHPEFVLHPQWKLQFSWPMFFEAYSKLAEHLGAVTPMFMSPVVFLSVSAAILLGLGYGTRRWAASAAGIVAILGVVMSLGFNKIRDGTLSFEFAYARVYLALPLLAAFVLVWFSEKIFLPKRASALILAVLCLFAIHRQLNLKMNVADIVRVRTPIVHTGATDLVLEICDETYQAAKAGGAELVIEDDEKALTYACGALWYGKLQTLLPSYDRRTAVVLAEAATERKTFLLVDGQFKNFSCEDPQLAGLGCQKVNNSGMLVLRSPGITATKLASRIGIDVRKF